MPKRRPKKPPGRSRPGAEPSPSDPKGEQAAPRPAGLPAPESVVGETEFQSPSGKKYRIIHTNETDPKDEEKPPKGRGGRREK